MHGIGVSVTVGNDFQRKPTHRTYQTSRPFAPPASGTVEVIDPSRICQVCKDRMDGKVFTVPQKLAPAPRVGVPEGEGPKTLWEWISWIF